jgi:GxxExxY protein
MTQQNKAKKDIIHADLSGRVIGVIFDVYNKLGHGHAESVYQKAVSTALKLLGVNFVEQLYAPVIYEGKVVGKNYFDFLIEGIMVVELKRGNYFVRSHIEQVYRYLVSKNLQLGLLVYFAPKTVHVKRVVNLK